ncbi:MAG: hypothetical protein QMC46_05155, partial [Burkholderiaceae bacterium]
AEYTSRYFNRIACSHWPLPVPPAMPDTSAVSRNLPVTEDLGKTPDMAPYAKEMAAQVSHACNNTWAFMRNVGD